VQAQGGVLAAAFASTRLLDDLNAVMFHAALAPLALVTIANVFRRREALFLTSVVIAFLPILLFVPLPLGPFRDVDSLGGFGAAVAVASAWAVARWLEAGEGGVDPRVRRVCALWVAGSVALPFVFTLVAATDLESGFERANAIVAGPPLRSATQRASVLDWIGTRALNESRFDVARDAFARLCRETPIPHALQLWGAAALLDRRPDVRAVFCSADAIAVGALFECQRRRVSVPADVAIAGFDDILAAALVHPPLTTVRLPHHAIGARAADLLLDRIAGKPIENPIVDMGFEIIVRGSTR